MRFNQRLALNIVWEYGPWNFVKLMYGQQLKAEKQLFVICHSKFWQSFVSLYKAKKNKCYVSKLVTNWKTWPKRGFFKRVFFFFYFYFFLSSRRVRFESVTALKYGSWVLDEQDTRQNTRVEEVCCSKCFIVFVISFLVYFDKKVHKKNEKKN